MDRMLILLKASSFSMYPLLEVLLKLKALESSTVSLVHYIQFASTSWNLLPFKIFKIRDHIKVTENHKWPAEELTHLQNTEFKWIFIHMS
jgi:hypothetical protein